MNFGGSNDSSQQQSSSQPILPGNFGKYGPVGIETGQLTAGLQNGAIPSLANLIQGYPTQGVAPLTSGQNFDINAFQNLAANPFALNQSQTQASDMYQGARHLNPYQSAAFGAFGPLSLGGPARGFSAQGGSPNSVENEAAAAFRSFLGGPNVAVPYGQKVFNDITAPTVASQMSLAGLGNSGALGENMALAGEQMALPMAEQGLQMEVAGAQGLSGLGTAEQNALLQASQQNLNALGMRTQAMEAGASGMAGMGNQLADQRLQAAGGLSNLGSQQFQQGITNLSNALTAAGIPQDQAQKILAAQYQQQMGQNQLGQNVQGTIMSWLPQALSGRRDTQSGSTGGFQWGVDPMKAASLFQGANGAGALSGLFG